MLTIGLVLLTISFICRYTVKAATRKAEEDLFLHSVLNKTATAETGLYYTGSTSGKAINVYCFFATIIWYLTMVSGAFCLGCGLIMLGR